MGRDGNHVDDAADGAGAVEIAGAAAHQFDAVDGELGLLLPVNPSADGVVEGHIVFGDQRAAGGGGTEAAQADALRGGIGHQRTGAAEQLDAGKLAQLAIHGDRGRIGEGGLCQEARGYRTLKRTERRAIRGDRDLFGSRDGFQLNDFILRHADCLLRKSRSRHEQLASIKTFDIHPAIRIAATAQGPGGIFCRSSGQRSAMAVGDGDAHGDCDIFSGLGTKA